MAAWVGAALTGLGALGGLFGKKQKQTSNTNYDRETTPTYDPTNQAFRDTLIKAYTDLVNTDSENTFRDAYTSSGLANILNVGRANSLATENALTSRGINLTTAGANAIRDTSVGTGASLTDFLNSVPLIMDDRRRANLGAASQYQAAIPVGQHQTGMEHSEGTAVMPGGIGPALTGGATTLAGFLGQWSAQKSFNDTLKALGKSGT